MSNVIKKIQEAPSIESLNGKLLFHGTCEEIEGDLMGGGDDVFWTATEPGFAQSYIPPFASYTYIRIPSYKSKNYVQPDQQCCVFNTVLPMMGIDIKNMEVETDKYGDVRTFVVPDDYPTYSDVIDFLEEELGCSADANGLYKVAFEYKGDIRTVTNTNKYQKGTLLIFDYPEDLKLKDLRGDRAGGMIDQEYHNYKGFQQAKNEGYDGIIINDLAQVDACGNIPHKSIGLFDHVVQRMPYEAIEASHFSPDDATIKYDNTDELHAYYCKVQYDHKIHKNILPIRFAIVAPSVIETDSIETSNYSIRNRTPHQSEYCLVSNALGELSNKAEELGAHGEFEVEIINLYAKINGNTSISRGYFDEIYYRLNQSKHNILYIPQTPLGSQNVLDIERIIDEQEYPLYLVNNNPALKHINSCYIVQCSLYTDLTPEEVLMLTSMALSVDPHQGPTSFFKGLNDTIVNYSRGDYHFMNVNGFNGTDRSGKSMYASGF